MSNARKGRYGWTKESWAVYKRWALDYAYEIKHAAARKVTAIMVAMGGWKMFDED